MARERAFGKAANSRRYQHITGRQQKRDVIAYQIRQSFKPGEITPAEANQIGHELAMRFTKGNHAFIVATHIDRAHIHNHIIYNSTSLDGSRKWRNFFLSGLAVQRLSDIICLEHGLSVIHPKPYRERAKRTLFPKKKSQRELLCDAIDNTEQIEYALQFESVLSNMETHFRNSMDYRGVGINALKMVCEFYNGDWAGVILAELDLSIWRPHWWYKPEDIDHTDELVHEFESCEGLERWIQCIRDNEPLVVSDIEAIKDSYSHIIDDDRRVNAARLEEAFYSGRTAPQPETPPVTSEQPKGTVESDQELLLKLLQKPGVADLLKTLAGAL